MTKQAINNLITTAFGRFVQYTKANFTPDIRLLDVGETDIRHTIFDAIGAVYEDYVAGTLGETVYGSSGCVIILYPFAIMDVNEFYHIFYHECAHYLFKDMNSDLARNQMLNQSARNVAYGYTLYDEFIADSYAHFITGKSFYTDSESASKELVNALHKALPQMQEDSIKVSISTLGTYCSMLLTDPYLVDIAEDIRYDRGFADYTELVVNKLEDIIELLAELIARENVFLISEKDLARIGDKLTNMLLAYSYS